MRQVAGHTGVLLACFLLVATMGGAGTQGESVELSPQASPLASDAANAMKRLEELVQQQQWEEAARLTQELVQGNPDNPVLHYWIGVVRWHEGDRVAAVQALRVAEQLGLDTALLHKTLGMVYYRMRQFILFRQQMEQAAARDPEDHQPHYRLGRYFESVQNDFRRALEFFEKAVALSPDHTESVYHQGYCLEALEREGEALRSYQAAAHLSEKNKDRFSWPYQAIARLLLDENVEQALDWARKAVELQPELDANHLVLAKIYERLGNVTKAMEELQETVRLNPGHTGAHYMLFKLYKKLGQPQQAQEELGIFEKLKAVYGEQ